MATNKKTLSDPSSLTPRPLRLRVETQPEEVRIEVVPLIDVIFCILTFFLLAAVGLSRQQAISVDLPKASTGTPQGRQILVVSLNELGQVYVEQQPITTKEQFLQRLQAYRQKNPDGLMALYASTNASYSQVVQVLDLLRQVGGERVALATLPGEAERSRTQGSNFNPGVPPVTGVPGYSPYPGTGSLSPNSGTQNPANPLNPAQPPLPGSPGQTAPGLPGGTLPNTPPSLPGQAPAKPGSSTAPSAGTKVSPKTNTVPGNPGELPLPGSQGTRKPNTAPGNPGEPPLPGSQGAPKPNTAP
jgi:biopolymer transport protein ExbD